MILKKKRFLEIIFLISISAVVYLPNIGKLTYFKDEWYFIYDAYIAGATVFRQMFSVDRPARGIFFEIYYLLFGPQPLPYHIGEYLWRVISMIGALWLFNILWPRDRRFTFFATLLFALYPGYFWWVGAIEYQPHIASLALQVVSIALTLKAIQSSRQMAKIVYLVCAILTGWIYIALVDYAIGMEVFRFFCVYMLTNREHQAYTFVNRLFSALRVWAWNILIPSVLILWRLFFFENERKATDIGLQLEGLFNDPISTLLEWGFQTYNSLLNLGVLAWVAQFPRFFFDLRLRDTIYGLVIMVIVVLLTLTAEKMLKQMEHTAADQASADARNVEALWLGILGMIFGVLPVVMANRYINIEGYSHYALPASLAASIFLTAIIFTISLRRLQVISLYLVIAFAALSHYSISMSAVNEESALEKFWWQVSWRVPMLRSGTTLVIQYPLYGMGDGGYGLMEAADIIYFPEPTGQIPVHYPVAGLTLNSETLPEILNGELFKHTQYRSHTVDFDYGNLLVITQPTLTSCVHVLDGHHPLISSYDPESVKLAAPFSKIENVIVNALPVVPPEFIFGKEPEHHWCFYFQKADLATQLGNWNDVSAIGEEAIQLELSPEDRSEWLPFLKAYAITGNAERLMQTAKRVVGDRFLRRQACDMLTNIEEPLTSEVIQIIAIDYCKTAPK